MAGGMLKWPTLTLTLTLKVVPNVGWGYAENPSPQPENLDFKCPYEIEIHKFPF